MTLNYLKGCGLALFGSAVTIREALTNGSLILTCAGGAMAVAGGWWAYQSKRMEFRTREVELRIRLKELERVDAGFPRPGSNAVEAKDPAKRG